MVEPLQRLLVFLSPAFPVGSFAWSAGLETAIAEGGVTDSPSLENWLRGALLHGGIRTDAILLAQAHRAMADGQALAELADLALALAAPRERFEETSVTGAAFIAAARTWPSEIHALLPDPCPYPVAVGAVAAALGVSEREALLGFLTALVHGQISVAVRLVPLGQTAGLATMAALEPAIAGLADAAAAAPLADIGGVGYAAEIAQMRHETLQPRIFRS